MAAFSWARKLQLTPTMHGHTSVAALPIVDTDSAKKDDGDFAFEAATSYRSPSPPESGVQLRRARLEDAAEWLVKGASGVTSPQELVAHLISRLREMGLPIERCGVFVSTLHPSIAGHGFIWSLGSPLDVRDVPYDVLASGPFAKSPIMVVTRTKRAIRRRIASPDCPRDYDIVEDLANEGITDYLALPLVFTTGECHAVTVATKAPGGFTEDHVEALHELMHPLGRVVEIFALQRIASTLLSTYVGHDSGERILRGRIQRGDTETIRSVIWFSDLRGFTSMSASRPAEETIDILNRVFDCQVPAIEKHGGEVLKFIGDGILAIFPIENDEDAARIAERGIEAAEEAQRELARLNAAEGYALRVGIALNMGDVAYGNIGSKNRLDFTAIGPAVNLTARLEGLTGKLDRPLVVSQEIASRTTRRTQSLGSFELKGVPHAIEAFALDDE